MGSGQMAQGRHLTSVFVSVLHEAMSYLRMTLAAASR